MCEIVKTLRNHYSLFVCVCVCVCVSVCLSVCVSVSLMACEQNGCTDLDAVFAKRLLTALARTLLGQRSRSQ